MLDLNRQPNRLVSFSTSMFKLVNSHRKSVAENNRINIDSLQIIANTATEGIMKCAVSAAVQDVMTLAICVAKKAPSRGYYARNGNLSSDAFAETITVAIHEGIA